jgi:hypothetical protein
MPIVCWGNLAKSADDTQRIEQAIQAYTEDHNENVNAHQIEGSSLYMHRVNEILDHLDGSIGLQKLSDTKFSIITGFESLDCWAYQRIAIVKLLGTKLQTYAFTPFESYLITPWWAGPVKLNFSKNSFFQTTVAFVENTAQLAYILAGAYPAKNSDDSYGYKIDDEKIYAFWTKEGTEYTEEISGIDILELNILGASFDATAQKIDFKVNGVLKYTATENLPITTNDQLFSYWLQADVEAAIKGMYVIDLHFEEDR